MKAPCQIMEADSRSPLAALAAALLDCLGDVPAAKRRRVEEAAAAVRALAPPPVYAGPLTVREWAAVFDCDRRTMGRILRSPAVRAVALTRQCWLVDLDQVPAAQRHRFSPGKETRLNSS